MYMPKCNNDSLYIPKCNFCIQKLSLLFFAVPVAIVVLQFFLDAVYMIPDQVRSGMKNNICYRVYMKAFPNKLIPKEAKLSREPANGQQKTNEKQDYACADRDMSRSHSGMSFDRHSYDSGIGSRTGIKVSIRNENRCELDLG